MNYDIRRYAEVDSTNAVCKQLACDGAPEGLVVAATSQTAGKGRMDRRWHSPEGGLWLSLLLRPHTRLATVPALTMAAGVAVAETIRESASLDARLKWPNDCLVHEKKVCGILAEGCFHGNALAFVTLGVGINVNNTFSGADVKDWLVPPASLSELAGRRFELDAVLHTFLSEFDKVYRLVAAERHKELADRWRGLAATLGRQVRILTGDSDCPVVEGVAEGIDDEFALLVRPAAGAVARIVAGDCIHMSAFCGSLQTDRRYLRWASRKSR